MACECGHVRYTLKTPYRDGTTRVLQPAGLHGKTGGTGAQAESEPHALPWGVRAEQQAALASDAEWTGQAATANRRLRVKTTSRAAARRA